MRFTRWLLGLAPLAACSSGQTGSPDCPGPSSCVCDSLYAPGTLLRVRAESFESGRLVAVAEEVFSAPDQATFVAAGDRIGGGLVSEKPCAPDESSASLSGVELFVSFF